MPRPSQLLAERKASRTASTNQEWTANYLYSQGHFETCLSYVASFAVSVGGKSFDTGFPMVIQWQLNRTYMK